MSKKDTAEPTPETTKNSPGGRKVIDAHALEVAAARGLNQLRIAEEFGVSQATLGNRLKADASLREAYERGLERAGKRPRSSSSKKAAPARPKGQSARPTPAPAAEAPSGAPGATFAREDDSRVFGELKRGPRCRQELREATHLTYDRINDSLYRLRFEHRLVGMVADRLGKEFFFILGDEEKAAARVRLASGGGPEAPPASPQIVEPRLVSDARLARTVEAVKGDREKLIVLPAANGSGHAPSVPESVPPPVHVPGLPPPETPLHERALRAALVEFGFINFWGAPSNRFADTHEMLAAAFGAFGGEVSGQ